MTRGLPASWLSLLLVAGCVPSPPESMEYASRSSAAAPPPRRPVSVASSSPPLVAAAREQVGVTRHYDPAYVVLAYPAGDVPQDRGVCTDVVIRALRKQGIDLQRALHEDMRAHFARYPRQWGLHGPDRNIDHRRVPNQMRWFERQGWGRHVSNVAADFQPGDIVAWTLTGSGLLHVGIVSDRKHRNGTPLVLHNIGGGTQENDILFSHAISGHYRPVLPAVVATAPGA